MGEGGSWKGDTDVSHDSAPNLSLLYKVKWRAKGRRRFCVEVADCLIKSLIYNFLIFVLCRAGLHTLPTDSIQAREE